MRHAFGGQQQSASCDHTVFPNQMAPALEPLSAGLKFAAPRPKPLALRPAALESNLSKNKRRGGGPRLGLN